MEKSDELLDIIFSSEGLLSRYLDNFEEREGQLAMARQIFEAYSQNKVALIEAGTGIGKSLAYLVPALFWALKHQEKTVISTHTISLQEQLIHKDIPFLMKALDMDLKAVLLKGMGNYLCLRKLGESAEQAVLFSEDNEELEAIEKWSKRTEEGSRSEITFPLSVSVWEKVNAEAETCSHVNCPQYKKCFFFKARRKAADAQILVVNHHLLFADLAARRRSDFREEKSILPSHERIILDEAHHLEEIALESLSRRFDRSGLHRQLSRLFSENNGEQNRLQALAFLLHDAAPDLLPRLQIDLPAEKRILSQKIETVFETIEQFCRNSESAENKVRLSPETFLQPFWEKEIAPAFNDLSDSLKKFAQSLFNLESDLANLKLPAIDEKLRGHMIELHGSASRMEESGEIIGGFFQEGEKRFRVRWLEMQPGPHRKNILFTDADLDISSYLGEHFFKPLSTASLCSATLTCGKNFEFIRGRLGISEENSTENIYHSPFDYQNCSLLAIPTDLPLPNDPTFIAAASEAIIASIEASRGSAFVLFTSYEMLRACYEIVAPQIDYPVLRQGDASRQTLIEKFKAQTGNVLFGTDSFWEGVDVAGDALRCVILTKLPFRVPTDPMVQAYSESLAEQGKDPFMDFAVPQAVMKFKQGFGRLIRNKSDRGCIVCLDKRLATKSYGKIFLDSLPPCGKVFGSSHTVFKALREFYGV